jgi:hypothetical protein
MKYFGLTRHTESMSAKIPEETKHSISEISARKKA